MSQPPHPMAGAQGHGAPIAPLSWKWRCGNRLRDMYFYSPEGKVFRSRTELASYLGGLPNGPSPGDFCWRVTPEIVKTGVWNKEEESPQKTLRTPKTPKAPKAPKTPTTPKTANSPKAPRLSTKTVETESPSKRSRNSYTGFNGPSQIPSPSSYNGIQFSQVEPLAIRAPGPILLRKTTNGSASPRPSGKGKKVEQARKEVPKEELPKEETPKWNEAPEKTETPKKPDSSYTFREILSEPSSFKLLFDTGNMDRFKEDARRLDSLSRQEIWELRKLLVDRNPQMGNMSKYPNAALKVFLRLLGTDGLSHEPSDQLGKVELADLCVKLAKVETAAP